MAKRNDKLVQGVLTSGQFQECSQRMILLHHRGMRNVLRDVSQVENMTALFCRIDLHKESRILGGIGLHEGIHFPHSNGYFQLKINVLYT